MRKTLILFLFATALSRAQTPAPSLTVNATANRHPINPDVYGIVNYGLDPNFAKEIKLPNTRWGGDGTTRYNWQVDSSNAGFDWYFMGGSGSSSPTPGAGPDAMIRNFQPAGTHPLITIPIIPYINSTAAWNCSFPVSVYGPQQSINPYVHPNGDNCGNSIAGTGNANGPSGTQLIDKSIYANHVNNSTQFQQNWIDHLLLTFGAAAKGGVTYYQLDNEPGGWGNTHRDVLPGGTNYDTIFSLGSEYAAMIKATDPTAQVMAPSDFTLGGWIGSSTDMQEHGGLYAGQWYLQQMQTAAQKNGSRMLDYFDEHYYGGSTTDDVYELESTRSFWDPTYNSGTWLEQYYFGNMQLIPRFKGWIQQYYPGTKLAFSEYSWGGHTTLAGALAETDILGILGREQVDFADMWDAPKSTDPAAYSFRLFRNYDGQGSQYGDTWIDSESSNQSQLAIYGAQRTSDNALTLIVINKTTGDLTSSISLSNFNPVSSASFYTYSAANLQQIVEQSALTVANSAVSAIFPARSASLILIPKSHTALGKTNWHVSASATAGGTYDGALQAPSSAIDGNSKTRWSTGHDQAPNQSFTVDMGTSQSFSGLTLDAGSSWNDYPRGYQVFISNDGQNWGNSIAAGAGNSAFLSIGFATQSARYLKIVQTGSSSSWWWSIAELNLLP